jgi:hypothetical protein
MINGRRTYQGGPWAYCQRCGTKTLVGNLKRQAGILVCYPYNCVDDQIIGQREARLARVIQQLPGKEMQPVPKVTMEDSPDGGMEAIEFGF